MGPSGPVSLWFFRKGKLEKKVLGTTREDKGKGLSLILNDWISSNNLFFQNCFSVSDLLSFLAAAQAQKYILQISKSSRLSMPHFECNVARVSEPRVIFTRKKNDLYQKLIAFQKRDRHTYNASCQSLAHYP